MTFRLPRAVDPVGPAESDVIHVEVDGEKMEGIAGQTIAGVLMSAGRVSWRRSGNGRLHPTGA